MVRLFLWSPSDGSSDYGPLRDAVFEDDVTTTAQWLEIVQHCQDHGYQEAVVDILAAITVMGAVKSATQRARGLQKRDRERQERKAREGDMGSVCREEEEEEDEELGMLADAEDNG